MGQRRIIRDDDGSPDAVTVSVVVPSYRRPESLAQCLAGLRSQTVEPLEVIVVIRDDDEATRRVVQQEAGNARVTLVDRPGQASALNAGVAAAEADVVAFTDDDAVPRIDWIERLTGHFAPAKVGGVGGRDVIAELGADDPEHLRVGTTSRSGRTYGNHHLAAGPARSVSWLKGVNMSFRRELCEFDETLRGSGAQFANDLEASLRITSEGWDLIYDPAVTVDHYPGPRFDSDGRDRQTNEALANAAFNEMLAFLRWLPWRQKLATCTYLLAVGTGPKTGPLGFLAKLPSTQGRRELARATTACTKGRLEAIVAWGKAKGRQ